jgi:hypothetical protein
MDSFWTEWKAARERGMADLTARLTAHFRAEGVVRETMPGAVKVWSLTSHCFIQEVVTPEYLAEHLVSRYDGFGFGLNIVSHTPGTCDRIYPAIWENPKASRYMGLGNINGTVDAEGKPRT